MKAAIFTEKQVNKVQNNVLKSATSLAGACRMYNNLFKSCNDLKKICKELDVPETIAVQLATIAKTKDKALNICCDMLPKVDDTFIKLVTYSKTYKDKKLKDKNTSISASMAKKIVCGTEYKSFGRCNPIKYANTAESYYSQIDKDEYTTTYVAVKLDSFSVRLVAKCIARYLTTLDK